MAICPPCLTRNLCVLNSFSAWDGVEWRAVSGCVCTPTHGGAVIDLEVRVICQPHPCWPFYLSGHGCPLVSAHGELPGALMAADTARPRRKGHWVAWSLSQPPYLQGSELLRPSSSLRVEPKAQPGGREVGTGSGAGAETAPTCYIPALGRVPGDHPSDPHSPSGGATLIS